MSKFLNIWMEGFSQPIGLLQKNSYGKILFKYNKDYISREDALPISLSIPLREEENSQEEVRYFFDNLLPENNQLNRVMKKFRISRDDIVNLLEKIGLDCPGALSCLPTEAPPIKRPGNLHRDYKILSENEILSIVEKLSNREDLPSNIRDASPVAGVQRKIALTLLPSGEYALPLTHGVPTTHILKVPSRNYPQEAQQETASALLALSSELEVAIPSLKIFGKFTAILIPRFDREINSQGQVNRIHQEDFAQALGLPSDLKYERRGYPGRRFDAESILYVLSKTRNPPRDIDRFIKATFFNLAIGNTDNHAKNHALLYLNSNKPDFAPLYDLVPIRLNPNYTDELSFNIGRAATPSDIDSIAISEFFSIFGLKIKEQYQLYLEEKIKPIFSNIDKATLKWPPSLKSFNDFIGNELSRLSTITNLNIPELRPRDYYAPRAGGWQSS